eukprot:gnl/TRDRNA2_/TRDRNA2_196628_c0_seq1.p1 gnl/TRDRNA2_/TRDRNA2_196628_c0~~gnl/TRDRNA2_/TRDRNA2_196628_c0_seq1.p1  ORF type:complete len:283 (+),score=51.32 gnl/TRDRNA2_/TRDRNA2_196628_c0_seq1:30-878(+)
MASLEWRCLSILLPIWATTVSAGYANSRFEDHITKLNNATFDDFHDAHKAAVVILYSGKKIPEHVGPEMSSAAKIFAEKYSEFPEVGWGHLMCAGVEGKLCHQYGVSPKFGSGPSNIFFWQSGKPTHTFVEQRQEFAPDLAGFVDFILRDRSPTIRTFPDSDLFVDDHLEELRHQLPSGMFMIVGFEEAEPQVTAVMTKIHQKLPGRTFSYMLVSKGGDADNPIKAFGSKKEDDVAFSGEVTYDSVGGWLQDIIYAVRKAKADLEKARKMKERDARGGKPEM